MTLSAQEQLAIELINRARLDPLGEAEAMGIDLNQGLPAGTITGAPKQVLAPNALLHTSSELHSNYMLEADVFSHTGSGGSNIRQRIEAAGYTLSGSWTIGENLAFTGTTGRLDLTGAIFEHNEGLFLSPGHRVNTLNGNFREIGVAQVEGVFTQNGTNFNASMLTLNFGKTGTSHFITGVAYNDTDGNDFYSVGEGRQGVVFGSSQTQFGATAAAGGYAYAVSGSPLTGVRIQDGARVMEVQVDSSRGNVKLDLVNGTLLKSSSSLLMGAGALNAELIGIENMNLTGNDAANQLFGNSGANILTAAGGNDSVLGWEGNDQIFGGWGNDVLDGGDDNDRMDGGSGNDSVFGGAGSDTVSGGFGDDVIDGGDGLDSLSFSGTENLTVDLRLTSAQVTGQGTDIIRNIENLSGANGNDSLIGSEAINVIIGGGGNDTIEGYGGSDRLMGGSGADRLFGGAGNDFIYGEDGDDTFLGGAGNDQMFGGVGVDTITFTGQAARVDLRITVAQNTNHGFDRIVDVENIGGTSGNDTLTGSDGANSIFAGAGNDVIEGARGSDLLVGGLGADQFIFRLGHGADTVRDFSKSEGDRLMLDDALWGNAPLTGTSVATQFATQVGANVVLSFSSTDTITLQNTTLDNLDAYITII